MGKDTQKNGFTNAAAESSNAAAGISVAVPAPPVPGQVGEDAALFAHALGATMDGPILEEIINSEGKIILLLCIMSKTQYAAKLIRENPSDPDGILEIFHKNLGIPEDSHIIATLRSVILARYTRGVALPVTILDIRPGRELTSTFTVVKDPRNINDTKYCYKCGSVDCIDFACENIVLPEKDTNCSYYEMGVVDGKIAIENAGGKSGDNNRGGGCGNVGEDIP